MSWCSIYLIGLVCKVIERNGAQQLKWCNFFWIGYRRHNHRQWRVKLCWCVVCLFYLMGDVLGVRWVQEDQNVQLSQLVQLSRSAGVRQSVKITFRGVHTQTGNADDPIGNVSFGWVVSMQTIVLGSVTRCCVKRRRVGFRMKKFE